jgi:GPH family glycoside/pentoside/hexuronide:cation symporter
MAGYPLDGALHRRVVEELARRAEGDAADPVPANSPGMEPADGHPGLSHQARGARV